VDIILLTSIRGFVLIVVLAVLQKYEKRAGDGREHFLMRGNIDISKIGENSLEYYFLKDIKYSLDVT